MWSSRVDEAAQPTSEAGNGASRGCACSMECAKMSLCERTSVNVHRAGCASTRAQLAMITHETLAQCGGNSEFQVGRRNAERSPVLETKLELGPRRGRLNEARAGARIQGSRRTSGAAATRASTSVLHGGDEKYDVRAHAAAAVQARWTSSLGRPLLFDRAHRHADPYSEPFSMQAWTRGLVVLLVLISVVRSPPPTPGHVLDA